eukprot:COSAG01_NODE_14995_length_1387_cov_1.253106_2_plen_129_part_00
MPVALARPAALTEVYLRRACSCPEIILRVQTPWGQGPHKPVQFLTGHSHQRKFTQLDGYATSFEAGCKLDTVGFISFPKTAPAPAYSVAAAAAATPPPPAAIRFRYFVMRTGSVAEIPLRFCSLHLRF